MNDHILPPAAVEEYSARRHLAIVCLCLSVVLILVGAGLLIAVTASALSRAWLTASILSMVVGLSCFLLSMFFAANAMDAVRPHPCGDGSDITENPCT